MHGCKAVNKTQLASTRSFAYKRPSNNERAQLRVTALCDLQEPNAYTAAAHMEGKVKTA